MIIRIGVPNTMWLLSVMSLISISGTMRIFSVVLLASYSNTILLSPMVFFIAVDNLMWLLFTMLRIGISNTVSRLPVTLVISYKFRWFLVMKLIGYVNMVNSWWFKNVYTRWLQVMLVILSEKCCNSCALFVLICRVIFMMHVYSWNISVSISLAYFYSPFGLTFFPI